MDPSDEDRADDNDDDDAEADDDELFVEEEGPFNAKDSMPGGRLVIVARTHSERHSLREVLPKTREKKEKNKQTQIQEKRKAREGKKERLNVHSDESWR